jgi:signal transduction histidine kinase
VSIGLRLTRAFVLVSLIIAAGAVVTLWQFNSVVRQTKNILAIDDRLAAADRLKRNITILQRQLAEAADRQDSQGLLQVITSSRGNLSKHLQQAQTAFRESGAVEPATLRASMASMQDEVEALERLAQVKDWLAIRLRIGVQLVQVQDEVALVVDEITAGVSGARDRALREIEARRSNAQNILAATALCSLLASLLLGFQVTRSITRPLNSLKRAAHQLASNDFHLSLETGSDDELAEVGLDVMAAARRLETSYNALTRSNEDLERFASAVSHDLQEPLRTTSLFAQLLEREHAATLSDKGAEYVRMIGEASIQMQRLLDGILEYSRVTSKEGHGFEQLSLQEVVNTALLNLHAAIEETGATVNCGALPWLQGNRVQMLQLFQNLIGNAIKYRREGVPPRIDIAARQQAGEWILSVTDNGVGVDPRYHDRIFDVFKQLDRRRGGIGLGLAMAKRIVEQHGGALWIESDGQTGSRFLFSIPGMEEKSTADANL